MRPARTTLPWQAPSAGVVVAGSTIGVGGAVFPITMAALSLAAGQTGRGC